MAKYLADELELQSVANAIRTKGNTSESLAFPTDFVSAIADIHAGGNIEEDGNGNLTFSTDGNVIGKMPLAVSAGGTYTPPAGKAYSVVEVNIGGNKPSKDVNFRDYDGTLVDSYTKEGFLALTAMPANPSHDGLTAQGWNWSLADAQAYVAKCGRLEVGQMYITDDGKTRIYIHLEEGRTSPMLGCCPNGTVDVDWGDGTAHDTLTGTSTTDVQWTSNHNYAAPGDYIIKLSITGEMGFYGTSSTNQHSGLLRFSSTDDSRNQIYQNAIQKIEIGNNIISIENYAFYNCYHLSSITIPNGMTNIGNGAFIRCNNLSFITIPNGIISIGDSAFNGCYILSSITIPNGVTSIGGYAFASCYNLSSITIPNGVISIGESAFQMCRSLSSITIPNGVTSIGRGMFYECNSLSSVTILNGVTSIGDSMFNNCYSLSSITMPDSVTSISNNAFYNCYSLSSIVIPDGVTSIGDYAFYYCYSLSSIIIPDSVISIGNYAFYYCYSLLSITMPGSVANIGTYVFTNCSSLSSIIIPNGIISVTQGMFNGCYSLSYIIIPASVTSIGNNAFNNCSGVAEYHFSKTIPPTLSSTNTFRNIPADCIIYVPYSEDHSILEAYRTATNWSTYASKIQEEPV